MAKKSSKKAELNISKKLSKAKQHLEEGKEYSITEGLEVLQKASYSKFDPTVEVHFNLDLDVTSPDQTVRVTTPLPHGTGKTIKVAAFSNSKIAGADLSLGEEGIKMIEDGKLKPKVDFQVVVAEPSIMPKLAKVAKILGPVGMMPNPKNGTVSDKLDKVVDELKKGRVELRTEANAPIIHSRLGKLSFGPDKLKENFSQILKTLKAAKPIKAEPKWITSCFLSTTHSPSVKISLE